MSQQNQTIDDVLKRIKPVQPDWMEKARARTQQLVMPTRALGRLHDISERLCGIQQTLEPSVEHKSILIMAGDHGVVDEGVSAYPQAVTPEMVKTFLRGGAGINALSRLTGADVYVVDMGIISDLEPGSLEGRDRLWVRKVGRGTANFVKGPAMTREMAVQSIMTGYESAAGLFETGVDILGTGDMGIGNTTPSAAVGCVVTGVSVDDMVGRGTGVDDEGLTRKKTAIQKGIEINQPNPKDGLDILAKVGGFEIGGIAGAILAGAAYGRAVVIDGYISTAGALIAQTLCPLVTDYLFAGHVSQESGHGAMLEFLGRTPILDLGMRLGEGTGGALAMGIIEGAARMFREVMTFAEAGVPDKE